MVKRWLTEFNRKLVFIAVITAFCVWSAFFIYRSSFVAIDGNRYFCLFDDAMISMRYAWNFATGSGLVWNNNERIEGFTNPLMTLIMALFIFLFGKNGAVLSVQIFGVFLMVLNACVVMRIAEFIRREGNVENSTFFKVFSFFCALSYYPLLFWSLMGMETGLLTLLLSLSIFFTLRYANEQKSTWGFLVSFFLGLAYFARPDAVIFALIILGYAVYCFRGRESERKSKSVVWMIVLYLAFPILQEVFRWNYYGELLPNTYTLKVTGMPTPIRISNGFNFVLQFLYSVDILLILLVVRLFYNRRPIKFFIVSILDAVLFYQVWVGGDPWDYWRMMSPVMPLIIALFFHEVLSFTIAVSDNEIFKKWFLRKPFLSKKYVSQFLVSVATLLVLSFINVHFLREITFLAPPYSTEYNRVNVNTALALRQVTAPGAKLAVSWAGSIPYYAERPSIDLLGKSDRYIARLPPDLSGAVAWSGMSSVPGHNKYDLNYSIKKLEPTYVQEFKWGRQNLSAWAKTRYTVVNYKGVALPLRKNSKFVLWNRISADRDSKPG